MRAIRNDQPASDVLGGLFASQKSLPTWLLYDETGCALYERITTLPEYYLTRAETDVLSRRSEDLVARAADASRSFALAEIGAGTATKTELLIAAALRRQGRCVYLACDIAPAPLTSAGLRLRKTCPGVEVRTFVGMHLEAGPEIAAIGDRQVLLFLGSSIGNYSDPEATDLLAGLRRFLRDDALLVLGTDLRKDPKVLCAAYDDAQGVTAGFTKNVLARLNREYACNFRLGTFRHVAEWVEASSNIEISLEARGRQQVEIGALGRDITLLDGERIHLETCAKYDSARVDRLLSGAGFTRVGTLLDSSERYAVQIARASARSP